MLFMAQGEKICWVREREKKKRKGEGEGESVSR